MRAWVWLWAPLSSIAIIAPAHAQLYRCDFGGKAVYADKPCGSDAKQREIHAPAAPAPQPAATPYAGSLQHEANMGRVALGQTAAQVEQAWGRPNARNADTRESGRTEQWVYRRPSGDAHVYFRDGVVSSINESERDPRAVSDEPARRTSSRRELEAEERAAKAAERKHAHIGEGSGQILSDLGPPLDKTFANGVECWHYEPTPLDQQTATKVCMLDGHVIDVDRRVVIR